jgi:hypothetical protein
MAAVTTKRTKASAVKQASIKDTNAFLESLPEKPKEDLSLREAVEQMRESVRGALAKGYSYQELAAMLTDQGIRISAFTLKNYVPSGRRRSLKDQQTAKPVQRRGRKAAGVEAADESTPATSKEATASAAKNGGVSSKATQDESKTTKAPRGRAKATTAAKAKSSSEATVKESVIQEPTIKRRRATRTANAANTLTSTRGRKKA